MVYSCSGKISESGQREKGEWLLKNAQNTQPLTYRVQALTIKTFKTSLCKLMGTKLRDEHSMASDLREDRTSGSPRREQCCFEHIL